MRALIKKFWVSWNIAPARAVRHTYLLVFRPRRFFVFTLITFELGLVPLPL
jgi:hypothetical protein